MKPHARCEIEGGLPMRNLRDLAFSDTQIFARCSKKAKQKSVIDTSFHFLTGRPDTVHCMRACGADDLDELLKATRDRPFLPCPTVVKSSASRDRTRCALLRRHVLLCSSRVRKITE